MSAAADVAQDSPARPTAEQVQAAWRAADVAVELARTLCGVHVAALYALHDDKPVLLGSRGLTQAGLDALSQAWPGERTSLTAGLMLVRDDPAFIVLPCLDGERLVGLGYLEGHVGSRILRRALLEPLARVLTGLIRPLAGVGGKRDAAADTPTSDPIDAEAVALYQLMEHHKWNVARVARVLGVTRMTVYNRLRRLGVPRQRVRRTPPRSGRARSAR